MSEKMEMIADDLFGAESFGGSGRKKGKSSGGGASGSWKPRTNKDKLADSVQCLGDTSMGVASGGFVGAATGAAYGVPGGLAGVAAGAYVGGVRGSIGGGIAGFSFSRACRNMLRDIFG